MGKRTKLCILPSTGAAALFTASVHRCRHRRPASLTLGIYFLPCFEGGVGGEGKKKASSVPLGALPARSLPYLLSLPGSSLWFWSLL